jgi:Ca2+-binding EF-hand superfamily protein
VSETLGRADRPRTRKSAAAVLGPREGEESCYHSSSSTTQLLSALRSAAFAAPQEVALSKSGANDVAEVCKMAKAMHVQVSEMQRHFVLFRKYAHVEEGASLVKHGSLNRDQFCQLVADNLFEGSQVEMGRCVDRAIAVADSTGTGLVSFERFALWMINHQTFDVNIHVDAQEREMRSIAREYKISVVEVDKYRRMFEELANASINRIERPRLLEMLHRCANVPRDLGLSAAREQALWNSADPTQRGCIDFEEFLVFNLKFFGKGA